jgi:hypothetical protein
MDLLFVLWVVADQIEFNGFVNAFYQCGGIGFRTNQNRSCRALFQAPLDHRLAIDFY